MLNRLHCKELVDGEKVETWIVRKLIMSHHRKVVSSNPIHLQHQSIKSCHKKPCSLKTTIYIKVVIRTHLHEGTTGCFELFLLFQQNEEWERKCNKQKEETWGRQRHILLSLFLEDKLFSYFMGKIRSFLGQMKSFNFI